MTFHARLTELIDRKKLGGFDGCAAENELNALLGDHAEAIRDLVEAAALVAEANDEDCRYDHDGYCQAHNLDHQLDGCRVGKLHNALAKLKEAE